MNSRQRRTFRRYLAQTKKKYLEKYRQGKKGSFIHIYSPGWPRFYVELKTGDAFNEIRISPVDHSSTMVSEWTWDCRAPYEELLSIPALEEVLFLHKHWNWYPVFKIKETSFFLYCQQIVDHDPNGGNFRLLSSINWLDLSSHTKDIRGGIMRDIHLRDEARTTFEDVCDSITKEQLEQLMYHMDLFI
jgi:hypothetical protein